MDASPLPPWLCLTPQPATSPALSFPCECPVFGNGSLGGLGEDPAFPAAAPSAGRREKRSLILHSGATGMLGEGGISALPGVPQAVSRTPGPSSCLCANGSLIYLGAFPNTGQKPIPTQTSFLCRKSCLRPVLRPVQSFPHLRQTLTAHPWCPPPVAAISSRA